MSGSIKTVLLLGTLSGLVLALGGSLGGEAGLLLAFCNCDRNELWLLLVVRTKLF